MQTNNSFAPPALAVAAQTAAVSGDLMFATVLSVREQGIKLIQAGEANIFDFSQVQRNDSAAVALLLEWWRAAISSGKPVRFTHLPPTMLALINVASLGDVLGESI